MAIAFWTFILTLWILGIGGGGFIGYLGCSNLDRHGPRHDQSEEDFKKEFRWTVVAAIGGWLVCIVTSSSFIVTVCRALYFAINSGEA